MKKQIQAGLPGCGASASLARFRAKEVRDMGAIGVLFGCFGRIIDGFRLLVYLVV